ncbi:MAG: outer membrane beta-barrel protein [Myxococcota bacterium]
MTRHLMLAGFLCALSGSALAAPADDKPADIDVENTDADEDVSVEEVANKSRRSSSSRARSSQSSRSSKPAARTNNNARSRTSAARAPSRAPAARAPSRAPASRATPSRTASRPSATRAASSSRASSSRAPAARSARPPASSRTAATRSARPAPRAATPARATPHRATRPPSRTAARPARPGAPHGRVAARPTHRVYHLRGAPRGWAPNYHRYHIRSVPHWHYRYWGAGVFIYNPPPPTHRVVVVDRNVRGERVGRSDEMPNRKVDRNGDFGFGLRAGTYSSGYEGGGGYGDFGLGLTARFRPVEAVGLEFAYEHHSETFDENTERINNPLQASVQLYAFPWTRVSPYVTAGLTWNNRSVNDDYFDASVGQTRVAEETGTLFGPHGGLGLELAIGDNAALNIEGRMVGYLNQEPDDLSANTAVQGTMGLNFYF